MHDRNESFFEPLETRMLLAAVFWDGGGGDEDWFNPLNWSGDVLPGPADDVTIDLANEEIVVRFGAGSATIASLHSEEELEILSGVLTVTGSAVSNGLVAIGGGVLVISGSWMQSGVLVVGSGVITGAGDLETAGSVVWSGGSIEGAGEWRALPGGAVEVTGSVSLNRRVHNHGTFTVASTFESTGDIINRPGASMLFSGNAHIILSGGALYNAGGMEVAGNSVRVTGTLATWGSFVLSQGIMEVSGTSWWAGSVVNAPGTTLRFLQRNVPSYHTFLAGGAVELRGTLEASGTSHEGNNRLQVVLDADTMDVSALDTSFAYLYIHAPLRVGAFFGWRGTRIVLRDDVTISGESSFYATSMFLSSGGGDPVIRVTSTGSMLVGTSVHIPVAVINSGFLRLRPYFNVSVERVENLKGATLEVSGRGTVTLGSGGMINEGTMTVPWDYVTIESSSGGFHSSGHMDVRDSLRLRTAGGSLTGTVLLDSADLFISTPGFVLDQGSVVSGNGTLWFTGIGVPDGAVIVRGEIHTTRLRMQSRDSRWEGGTFTGVWMYLSQSQIEAVNDVVLNCEVNIRSESTLGKAGQTGRITVGRTGIVALGDSAGVSVQGILIVYGRMTFSHGRLTFGADTRVIIAPGAVFSATSGRIELRPGNLTVRGEFIKHQSSTLRIAGDAGVAAPLAGRYVVEGGTLEVAANGRHLAAFVIEAGGRLSFLNQPHRLDDSAAITGEGTLTIGSGSLTVWGVVDVAKMEIDGSGRLIVREDVVTIAETVNMSSGAIVLMRGAVLDIEGVYEQTGGILRIHASGSGAGEYGRIGAAEAHVSGDAVMRLHLAYEPEAGEVIEFLTAGARTGEFLNAAVLNLPPVPALAWELEYLPGGVRLVFV